MREVYRSSLYSPQRVSRTYVSYFPYHESFRTYEVEASGKTIREWDSDGSEYPPEFKDAVKSNAGQAFRALEWKI